MDNPEPDLDEWRNMVKRHENTTKTVTVGLVGKYCALPDAYLSVMEALRHAGFANDATLDIKLINAEEITRETVGEILKECQAIIVPGGFGERGIDGMLETARYARENKIPFLGLSLGMNIAAIEFARNVLGIQNANSVEYGDENSEKIIDINPDQKDTEKETPMRLGLCPCKLEEGTISHAAYGDPLIYERHRHRYEFNNLYRSRFAEKGCIIAGVSPDDKLVEIIELSRDLHPWYVGAQFHPEFISRPNRPHLLLVDFIKAVDG